MFHIGKNERATNMHFFAKVYFEAPIILEIYNVGAASVSLAASYIESFWFGHLQNIIHTKS